MWWPFSPLLARAAVIALLGASLAQGTVASGTPGAVRESARQHLVACAPGYPGSTRQAQPTMDAFASMLAQAAGWPEGTLSAEYQAREVPGIQRIRDPGTSLVLVPLPLLLKYEQELALRPIAQVVDRQGASNESWSLVAARGRVQRSQDLAGWEVIGIPAYAPAFVRGPILGSWGPLPATTQVRFDRRVLGALRRALAGENVAVILDSAQTAALADLPDTDKLEVVARSKPVPAAVLAAVDDRIGDPELSALTRGLWHVHELDRFTEVLDTLRLTRFEPLDVAALQAARTAYRQAR